MKRRIYIQLFTLISIIIMITCVFSINRSIDWRSAGIQIVYISWVVILFEVAYNCHLKLSGYLSFDLVNKRFLYFMIVINFILSIIFTIIVNSSGNIPIIIASINSMITLYYINTTIYFNNKNLLFRNKNISLLDITELDIVSNKLIVKLGKREHVIRGKKEILESLKKQIDKNFKD